VSGGTSVGNSGLVFVKQQTIGTAVASVIVSDVFSATYDNYLVTVTDVDSSASAPSARLTFGGVAGSAYYGTKYYDRYTGSDTGAIRTNAGAFLPSGIYGDSDEGTQTITIYNPFASKRTAFTSQYYGGGAGGSATPTAGGAGGTTSFGSILTAGGGGGSGVASASTYAYSDAFMNNGGGSASGADLIIEGQDGLTGIILTPTAATFQGGGKGGPGGGTFLGVGGTSSSAAAGGGNVGTYGGGGGGRFSGASSAASTGHAGATGICIVELYA
jgi:hypothetical protein